MSYSYDDVYVLYAWRDNRRHLVLTQGEGYSGTLTNNDVVKAPRFQLKDERGVIAIPTSGNPIVQLAVTRSNRTEDLLTCVIEDSENGIIYCPITKSLSDIAGDIKGEIRLITANAVTKFYGVDFYVFNGVSDSAAAQSTQFSDLIHALQKVINITGGGTVADMDDVIEHGGLNPVASGVIYDYLNGNFYTKIQADDKFQTIANKTQTIDSDRQTTTQNAQQYPSVAAVKEFLYANFMTEEEIYDYLDSFYTQAEADNKFALKSNTYTKSEINTIQTENDKRFALHMSVAFDENGIPVKFVDRNSLSAGDFTGDSITSAFIGSNVSLIQSGTFVTCTNLTDVYIDKSQSSITIQEQAFPAGAAIHYMDGFNVNELIIAAIKYLNTIKANAADVYTKSEVNQKIIEEVSKVTTYKISVILDKSAWDNNLQSIAVSSPLYTINQNTEVTMKLSELAKTQLDSCGCESISVETVFDDELEEYILTFEVEGETPTTNITVDLWFNDVVDLTSQ